MADQKNGKAMVAGMPRAVLGAAAAVALILLLGMGLLAVQFERDRVLRAEVDRSYESRAQIQALLSLHQDVETGQRGYVLTRNPDFLDPFRKAEARAVQEVATLSRMAESSPALWEEAAAVSRLTRQKLEFARDAIRLTAEGRSEEAQRLVASGRGKAIMDEIRARLARMDALERAELERRIARADRSRMSTQWLSFALQTLLILLLVYAASRVSRSMAAERETRLRLQELSARQVAIFDAATDGMLTLEGDGAIQSLNPAVAKMYGYRPEELVGRNIAILFEQPPGQKALEVFLQRVATDAEGKAAKIQEFGGRRSDGTPFPVDVSVSHVPLPSGSCFLAVIRDATERKRMDRMKSEFVSTVSHELRTPLTSIAGSLGLLAGGAAGDLPDRAKRLIDIAHTNSKRLVRLINDILDVEKIEAGKMEFDLQPVPLRPAVEQSIESNKAYAEEYGITLRLEEGEDNAVVMADPDRLAQVLTNLLSNAAKFSPRGEEVRVRIEPGGRRHRVTVSDKGPGIPAEFKDRIFGKFAQADASDTRQKGGTGLGLSIVREIVTRLGGSVSFDSEPGKGTSFHIDLPAAPAGGGA